MDQLLTSLPLIELRQMLRDTERTAGPKAQSTAILRRLVEKREREAPASREVARA